MRTLILYCYFLFLLGVSNKINAQSLQVDYTVAQQSENPLYATNTRYYLKIKDSQSIFFNKMDDSLTQFVHGDKIIKTASENGELKVYFSNLEFAYASTHNYYKNYVQDTLLYVSQHAVKKQHVVIGEKFNIFKWYIKPDKDTTILTYPCKTATMDFRGRKYVAYFAPTLCPYGGPWKFDGLPGLILSIHSIDGYFSLQATKISLNTSLENIENPFKGVPSTQIYTWNQMVEQTKLRMENFIKKARAMAQDGEKFSIKIGGIEDLEIGEMSTDKKPKKDKKKKK
jgi:GLPGLI family protein